MLGPALLALGLLALLGIFKRLTLFAMALLYTSLTYGLVLIKQDGGVAWLGIHIALIAMGLALARHDRFALTQKL
jgi:thiosulfate dehydrogenase [quinone] large subunit